MGHKSTCDITRNDALGEVMRHLLTCSDEQLADVLEDLVGEDYSLNFYIVSDYDENEWNINYKNRGPFC